MEKKAAYEGLAEWFEYLNDDCGYEKWSQYLISKLKCFPLTTGLDVGCGSGWFTRAFRRAGYDMAGLDLSPAMLSRAEALAFEEGLKIRYLQGDVARFRALEKYDFITAINDCINYISKEKLLSAFENVRSALNKNGIFLFDISSARKFREKIANTVCADDREDVTYLSFNSLEGEKAVMDVTLFVRRRDGAFERRDERHIQYIYEEAEIVAALEKAGFSLLETEGHLGEEKSESDRLIFLARRK